MAVTLRCQYPSVQPQMFFDADGRQIRPLPMSGRAMRYLVMAELIQAGVPISVAEPADRFAQQDLLLPDRPSKAVSDAIRWEVRKGRAVRVSRGVYRLGAIPRSTRYWMLDKGRRYRAEHLEQLEGLSLQRWTEPPPA